MKKFISSSIFIFFSIFLVSAAEKPVKEVSGVERYAIYIGSNYGGKGKDKLLYAGTDAQSFQKTMTEIGGIAEKNSCLLIDPTKNDVDMALEFVTAQIEKNKFTAKRSEFIFYYSGHSDENALLLGDNTYNYSELKAAITEVPSDVHVVILDSCYSGNFIRTKGGQKKKPFLFDDTSVVKGHAYLSSSSELESSQESDEIGSSFFTNAVITGLRGAADTSGDNKVTLNELYSYAFNETLAKTEGTKAGPQHPNYNITLVGSGDLILSDISTSDTILSIAKEVEGRFIIRDASGKLISEINKNRGQEISMALPVGNYSVVLKKGAETKQGDFTLVKDQIFVLEENLVHKVETKKNKLRGGTYEDEDSDEENSEEDVVEESEEIVIEETVKEAELESVESVTVSEVQDEENFENEEFDSDEKPYKFSFEAIGTIFPIRKVENEDFVVNFGAGVFGSVEYNIKGIQISTLFNYADTVAGSQISAIYNGTEELHGTQVSAITNYAYDMNGAQISAICNFAGEMRGLQIAPIFNSSKLNKGLQIGLVNYTEKNEGVSLGLLNICKEGVMNIGYHYDNDDMASFEWACGSNKLYTIYGVSISREYLFGEDPERDFATALYIGFGDCSAISFDKSFYFTSEILFKSILSTTYEKAPSFDDTLNFSYRLALNKDLGFIFKGFTIYGGAEFGFGKTNKAYSAYSRAWQWDYEIGDIAVSNNVNLFFGVKFGFHNG